MTQTDAVHMDSTFIHSSIRPSFHGEKRYWPRESTSRKVENDSEQDDFG